MSQSISLLLLSFYSWTARTRQTTAPFAGEFDLCNFSRTFATAGIDVFAVVPGGLAVFTYSLTNRPTDSGVRGCESTTILGAGYDKVF